MKTKILLGIVATLALSFVVVGIEGAQAYSIDGYVKHIKEEIDKGMDSFKNQTITNEVNEIEKAIAMKALEFP